MRKIIRILFLVAVCFSIIGCGKETPKQKIELNKENINEYIKVEVKISNFDYQITNTLVATDYLGTANLEVSIKSTEELLFEDAKITIDLGLVGWTGGILTIELDNKGNYLTSKIIEYKTTGMPPFSPTYYERNLTFASVSGYIYK